MKKYVKNIQVNSSHQKNHSNALMLNTYTKNESKTSFERKIIIIFINKDFRSHRRLETNKKYSV